MDIFGQRPYPKYVQYISDMRERIYSMYNYIDIIDCREFLENLTSEIDHYEELVRRHKGVLLLYPFPRSEYAEMVEDRIEELIPAWYKSTTVFTDETEIVNGYALQNTDCLSSVSYPLFKQL